MIKFNKLKKLFFKSKKIQFIFFFSLFVYLVIYLQSRNPLWHNHLEIDTWVWFLRLDFFRQHFSFAKLANNEFLPATLLFLFLPASFYKLSLLTYALYLKGVFFVITAFFFLHVLFIYKNTSFIQTLTFLLLILAFGPIIFYRFETAVTLLVIISILFWKKSYALSGFFLGWASAMKVYPIIFIPYFLLLIWHKKHSLSSLITYLCSFILAPILFQLIFFSLGGNWQQTIEALNFHSLKYVGTASLYGVIITAWSLATTHLPPVLLGGFGVWGINSPLINKLGLSFFNYIWTLPIAAFYIWLIQKKQFLQKLQVSILFFLTLLFLIFAKNLNPQYFLWIISLFPFVNIKHNKWLNYLILCLLLFIATYINQLVYPLLYNNYIEGFYKNGLYPETFYFQFLKIIILVYLAIISFKNIF